ncbi:MAG: porin family protein [Gammaproteobacteria bacterium]
MKEAKMRGLLSLLGLLAVAPATSEELFPNDRRGSYLGGGVTVTNVYAEDADVAAGSFERGDSDYGFTISAGYRFNPIISVELSYLDGGMPEFNASAFGSRVDADVDLTAWQFAGIGTLPFGTRWELYLKLGLSAWDANSDQVLTPVTGPVQFRREDRSGIGVLIGVGLGVTIVENLFARLEYQTFGIDDELLALDVIDTIEDDASFDSLNLELHYRFGGKKKSKRLVRPE